MCKVVVGVGHVDQTLDEVGTLDEAEEHLRTSTQDDLSCTAFQHSAVHFCSGVYLSEPRDVQPFPMIYGRLA